MTLVPEVERRFGDVDLKLVDMHRHLLSLPVPMVGTAFGTFAAGDDPRLSDSRPPTGGAGGVLSGSYPNPGFAVNMAEQSELDAHAADTTSVHGIADTTALVLTTDARFTTITANRQTASYTLVLGDAAKVIEMDVASANTLTIPPNSSVAFPTGTVLEGVQYGAGQTTITPGSGVTIRSSGAKLKSAAQYAQFSLRKIATDEWIVAGDLSA